MLLLHRLTWLRIAAAWGFFTLFMLVLVYAQALVGTTPWHGRALLLAPLIYGLTGALLTPFVFWLAQRFDLTAGRARWLPYLLLHAGASVVLTIVYRAIFLSTLFLTSGGQGPVSWRQFWRGSIPGRPSTGCCCAWCTASTTTPAGSTAAWKPAAWPRSSPKASCKC